MSNPQTQDHDSFWTWESFLMGGGSILTCMACWAFVDRGGTLLTMSQFAFGAAFAVNHPHFLSSYVLLYRDFRKTLPRDFRFYWATLGAPLLLGGFLLTSLITAHADWLGHSINLMYFLVGWHYVKQVFGCVVVTSARRKIFYSAWERQVLLANLLSLWSMSFLQSQTSSGSFAFYGIVYPGLHLPTWSLSLAYALVTVSGAAVVMTFGKKYVEEGVRPSASGAVALLALYVWYIPTFSHPAFGYLIPFFHSLQYLAFVWRFKSNQVRAQGALLAPRDRRLHWMNHFLGYAAGVSILGAMAFEFVPKALDSQRWIQHPELGTSPILACFLLFINIHHYFIDNVIWRSNNQEVRRHLFETRVLTDEANPRATNKAA